MRSASRKQFAGYLRSFIFGVEDSLVSTVGLLSGIAISASRGAVLLTGVIYILVEAFSMAAGNFLSEQAADEYEGKSERSSLSESIATGVIMFISFSIAGLVPLLPYLILTTRAFAVSIIASLIALFIVGVISAKFVRVNSARRGLEMLIVGGAAILVGIVAGKLVGVS